MTLFTDKRHLQMHILVYVQRKKNDAKMHVNCNVKFTSSLSFNQMNPTIYINNVGVKEYRSKIVLYRHIRKRTMCAIVLQTRSLQYHHHGRILLSVGRRARVTNVRTVFT